MVLLAVLCAFSFGAIVKAASANNYHVTCVEHGFYSGGSTTDGSFFSRVSSGCSSNYRYCAIYSYGVARGAQEVFNSSSLCNAWSRDFGEYTECAGSAVLNNPGSFNTHSHLASNWCG